MRRRKNSMSFLLKKFKKIGAVDLKVKDGELILTLKEGEELNIKQAEEKLKVINERKIASKRIPKRLFVNKSLDELNVFERKIVFLTQKAYYRILKNYKRESLPYKNVKYDK